MARNTGRQGTCKVRDVLTQLSPEDADDLKALLLGTSPTIASIRTALLDDFAIEVGQNALQRHRRRLQRAAGREVMSGDECKCPV